jgi:lysophospholipase L1-like esterase
VTLSLLSGGALIVALLWALLFLPGPRISFSDNGASISFAADRLLVFKPGDCITARWDVENIKAVYLNDDGVTGHDQRVVCVSKGVVPVLRVEFKDGASSNYNLHVGILVLNPVTWALALVALGMGTLAGYLTVRRWLAPLGKPLKRLVKIVAVLLLSVVLLALVLEACLRIYLTNFGTEEERELYLYSADQLRLLGNKAIPLPYLNYGLAPRGDVNSLGYRHPEIQIPKPPGVYRIVAMGNSTTWGSGIKDWQDTYPGQLEKILRDEYGYKNVEVLNDGVDAATSWYTAVDLEFRVLEVQPDLVIVYQGNMDIGATLVDPDCYQGMNPHRGISPDTGVWQLRPEPLSPSALYRFVAINLGWMPNPQLSALPLETVIPCAEQRTLSDEQASTVNPPVYFERNLQTIIGIARVHHVQVLLSTWAYYPKGSQELTTPWFFRAADKNNQIIAKVALEMSVPFYDLQANLPQNPDLWEGDGNHFTPLGAHAQAEQYAASIVAQGLIPKM